MAIIKDRLQRRLASQPLEYPSAGSVFRNPAPDMPSGKLIDDLGLKGKRIGDAMISVKHANFIINLGIAKSKREAREFIEAGAISINGEKVTNIETIIDKTMFIENTYIVVRRGKKNYYIGKIK